LLHFDRSIMMREGPKLAELHRMPQRQVMVLLSRRSVELALQTLPSLVVRVGQLVAGFAPLPACASTPMSEDIERQLTARKATYTLF
jgi:hypothetical protein